MNILAYYTLIGLSVYSFLVTLLFSISPFVRQAEFFARLLISWACLFGCAAYGVFASVALQIAGYGGLGQWTTGRAFKWAMKFTMGVTFVIEGEENLTPRPAVFIGNHQTCVKTENSSR